MSDRRYIQVLDMTRMVKKEMLLYSFFDISFKSPIRIMVGVYFLILAAIYSLPVIFIYSLLGIDYISIWWLALAFGPPIVFANLMSKPIWGGKPFFDWFKAQMFYATTPKTFHDGVHRKDLVRTYTTESFISVSRARDYKSLRKGLFRRGKK